MSASNTIKNIKTQKSFANQFSSNPFADTKKLVVQKTSCCLCEIEESEIVGVGEDFEYKTSPDEFKARRCLNCSLIYLSPRPSLEEFARIYPPNYHAFEFSEKEFGFVFKVRRRLEARRLLNWCINLPPKARILDIGCGDGFHMELLRDFGRETWTIEGVDADPRAAAIAEKKGLKVHCGLLENLDLPRSIYDLAILVQTIEHVADPPGLIRDIRSLLRPGGRLVIVTDNTDSLDFKLFQKRYWGGYHFPRHWNLFNKKTIHRLAENAEMEVETLKTQVSPVNWVYSVRNGLTDKNASPRLIELFSLKSTISLGFFTIFDIFNNFAGRGALLNAILKRPLD